MVQFIFLHKKQPLGPNLNLQKKCNFFGINRVKYFIYQKTIYNLVYFQIKSNPIQSNAW